jgi:FtsP/CotA-like multicopper oxidase with cupredoxin domain
MPPNRDPEPVDHTMPHQFNTTNLHSHGLHVSPSGISDNVMRMMEPVKSYDIEIAIPSDQIPGTNWYHPHAHGSADVQIASGAVGARSSKAISLMSQKSRPRRSACSC